MKKHAFSLLLVLVLAIWLLPFSAQAEMTDSGLVYMVYDDHVAITGYAGSSTLVTIPDTLGGKPVTIIETMAFSECESLKAVDIGDNVTTIGEKAFYACPNLVNVEFGSSVTTIGNAAFRECDKLASLVLEGKIGTIEEYAFYNCDKLTSVRIGDSVTSIGKEAFYGCDGLTNVQIGNGLTAIAEKTFQHCDNLTSVQIGNRVTSIGDHAFTSCTKLTGLTIPNSVTFIDKDAFSYCRGLTSLVIPNSVTAIDEAAFSNCSGITSVQIGSGVTSIGKEAFYGCDGLTSLTIPNNVTAIGKAIFENCDNLTSVQIGNSITTISEEAFYNCDALTSVKFGSAVTTIGDEAFNDCDALARIDFPRSITSIGNSSFYHCDNLTNINFGSCAATIGELAFSKCNALTRVTIGSNITGIGRQAFEECSNLAQVEIGGKVQYISIHAFRNCTRLSSIVIPDSVTSINNGAFYGCSKLASVKFGSGLTELGTTVFQKCSKLNNVVLPNSLESIGFAAFDSCTSLTKIVIPDSVTTLDVCIFDNCTSLTDVVIGKNIKRIPDFTFDGCTRLQRVYFRGNKPTILLYSFNGTPATCYYPSDNSTWSGYKDTFSGTLTWVPYTPSPFGDIAPWEWYHDPVKWAVDNGITTGASADLFNPNGACLRAQVVTFLHRAAKNPEPSSTRNPFTDVKSSDFFYKPVLWAVEKGITNGVSATEFGSYANCNRAAVVTFLWRASGSPNPTSTSNPFTDVKTTDFFYKPVLWAVENGITNGISATEFGPTANCNRAQVVTFLYRAKDLLKDEQHSGNYSFEIRSNTSDSSVGVTKCDGTSFAVGEEVIFYAEPNFGYLVDLTVSPGNADLELNYIGLGYYKMIMPAYDVVVTATFSPAEGNYHYITGSIYYGSCLVVCASDAEDNLIAKPGEHIYLLLIPNDGYPYIELGITANNESQDWSYQGTVEDDPDLGTYHIVEFIMPNADVEIYMECSATQSSDSVDVSTPNAVPIIPKAAPIPLPSI